MFYGLVILFFVGMIIPAHATTTIETISTISYSFNDPWKVAVDSNDRIIVLNLLDPNVYVFDSSGNHEFTITNSTFSNFLSSVATDTNDRIIVGDSTNKNIYIFDSLGNFENIFPVVSHVGDIATDSNDRIIVTDNVRNAIHIFDSLGNLEFSITNSVLENPIVVTTDSSNRIIVADATNDSIHIFDSLGNLEFSIIPVASVYNNNGENVLFRYIFIDTPFGIATDSNDRIFVADNGFFGSSIHVFDSDGNLESIIKKDQTNIIWTAIFNTFPDLNSITSTFDVKLLRDITIDSNDNIIIADMGDDTVRTIKISTTLDKKSTTKKKSGGCSGDCTDPTFFKNEDGKEIVENGFELKGKATDVVDYHVPWQLITLNTDQTYNMKLKVYENNALKWIGVYFGVPEIGASLNDAESEVIFHLNYDKHIEEITTVDRHTLVDILSHRISQVDCGYADSQCYLLNFDFVFRDKQKNNVVAIQAVDYARNSAVHYINDGIEIVGDSMNEPLYSDASVSQGGAFYPQRAGTVELTLVDYKTDMWQDKYGYLWKTNNYGFYIIDTVSMPLKEPDVMWQAMTRMNSNFADMIIYEQDRAMLVYPSEEAFADFKESFAYELPKTKAQQQTELDQRIADEIKRITSLTKDYTKHQQLYTQDSDNHWIYLGDLTAAELEYLDAKKGCRNKCSN